MENRCRIQGPRQINRLETLIKVLVTFRNPKTLKFSLTCDMECLRNQLRTTVIKKRKAHKNPTTTICALLFVAAFGGAGEDGGGIAVGPSVLPFAGAAIGAAAGLSAASAHALLFVVCPICLLAGTDRLATRSWVHRGGALRGSQQSTVGGRREGPL